MQSNTAPMMPAGSIAFPDRDFNLKKVRLDKQYTATSLLSVHKGG
jgi:hypothetical protein